MPMPLAPPIQARWIATGHPEVTVSWGWCASPVGPMLLAWIGRELVFLGFQGTLSRDHALAELRSQWPAVPLQEQEAARWRPLVFAHKCVEPLPVCLYGSPFQLRVWQALGQIAPGTRISYGQLATRLEAPGAARAVGSAVGANPLSWLLPCHRVIRANGQLGQYRWGARIKAQLLGAEGLSLQPLVTGQQLRGQRLGNR